MLTDEMRDDGWVEHTGGPCPVNESEPVEAMLRDGRAGIRAAFTLFWNHDGRDDDIVAYRLAPDFQPWKEPSQ